MNHSIKVSTATACLLAVACTGAPTSGGGGGPNVDEASFMLSLQSYRTSGEFTEVTREAYPSAVADATIRVWISTFAATAYRQIDPDKTGSDIKLPEGALIIREVYDGATLKKLTLMGKGAKGYNPVVGDYWYGVTDPDGTPQTENGAVLTGKLEQCFGCHQARGAVDDFLFGVPAASRAGDEPPVTPPPPPPVDPGPICGDFACEVPESCSLCPSDCCYVDDDDGDDDDDDHGGGDDDDGDDDDDDHGGDD